jgi:hypothetical protein
LFSYRCIDVCTVYSLQYAHTVLCSCSHLLRIHSIRILASITHSTFVLCSTSLQAMFSHDVGAQLVPRKSPLAPLPSCKEQSLSSILWAPLLPLGTTLPPSGSTLRAPETPGADANGAEPHFPEPSTFGSFLLPDSHPQTPNRSRSQWATSCLTLRAGLRPEQKPRIPPPPLGITYVCTPYPVLPFPRVFSDREILRQSLLHSFFARSCLFRANGVLRVPAIRSLDSLWRYGVSDGGCWWLLEDPATKSLVRKKTNNRSSQSFLTQFDASAKLRCALCFFFFPSDIQGSLILTKCT